MRLVAPAASRVGREALVAVGLEDGRVRHGDERHLDARADLGEALEARRVRIPCASARSPASRMTGPSASGSEKGKPISSRSAPPSTAAAASSGVSGPAIR